jgi:tryptophan-rich sensory protein
LSYSGDVLPLSFIYIFPLRNAWAWALSVCAAAAVLEGAMSGTHVKSRFAELRLPRFGPPLWAWPIVGLAYYVLFFFLLESLLAGPAVPCWTAVALGLTALLLTANAIWNWLFFRKKDLRISFVFFFPYFLAALTLAAVLVRVDSPLPRWYALYLVYLVYAACWVWRVWRLNDSPVKARQH